MLTYRNARIEQLIPAYSDLMGLGLGPRPTLVYTHQHGHPGTLYGGLLTENIVQAICRDLLAAALVECERLCLGACLHVHDEIVVEVPCECDLTVQEMLVELCCAMSTPPAWAEGFPIAVEGFSNPRYTKSPFKGSYLCEASGGVVTRSYRKSM